MKNRYIGSVEITAFDILWRLLLLQSDAFCRQFICVFFCFVFLDFYIM